MSGDLLSRGQGGTGSVVPASLAELASATLELRGDPDVKMPLGWWSTAWRMQLDPARGVFVDFRNVAPYPFPAYLPQLAVLLPARWFGLRPLLLLFLARLASIVAGTALVAWAIRLLPERQWFSACLALAPMSTALRASASCDAVMIGCAWLLAAAAARLGRESDPQRAVRFGWIAVGAAGGLALTKLPYLPLALVPLWGLLRRPAAGGRPLRRIAAALLLVLLAAGGFAAWQAATHGAPLRPGVDRERQVHDALAEPLRFFAIVARDDLRYGPRYLVQAIGVQLGWLDTRLPWALVFLYAGVLAVLLLERGDAAERPAAGLRWATAAAVVLTTLLMSASQYATWTPYRAAWLEGLQGRHFLPLAPFVALLVPRLNGNLDFRLRLAGLAALLAVTYAVTAHAVWTRYYF